MVKVKKDPLIKLNTSERITSPICFFFKSFYPRVAKLWLLSNVNVGMMF